MFILTSCIVEKLIKLCHVIQQLNSKVLLQGNVLTIKIRCFTFRFPNSFFRFISSCFTATFEKVSKRAVDLSILWVGGVLKRVFEISEFDIRSWNSTLMDLIKSIWFTAKLLGTPIMFIWQCRRCWSNTFKWHFTSWILDSKDSSLASNWCISDGKWWFSISNDCNRRLNLSNSEARCCWDSIALPNFDEMKSSDEFPYKSLFDKTVGVVIAEDSWIDIHTQNANLA